MVWQWHLNAYFFSCEGEGLKYSEAKRPSTEAVAYPGVYKLKFENKRKEGVEREYERKGKKEGQDDMLQNKHGKW